MDTLNEAIAKEKDVNRLITHSNQRFQYSSYKYKSIYELNLITISMAQKGTAIDDYLIEKLEYSSKKVLYNNNITYSNIYNL